MVMVKYIKFCNVLIQIFLAAPNFVSSLTYGDYIYFFFRETAVEYMNCGKVIYSRVARVCKHDKGGPHQSRDRWTTFLKARLNCSVPGEYPFYFDEIRKILFINKKKKVITFILFQNPLVT